MKTTATKTRLSDLGTSGLLQWISAGENAAANYRTSHAVYCMRRGKAAKVIAARYGAEAVTVFHKVARREHEARLSVRRLKDGGAVLCQAMMEGARVSGQSVKDLCRAADCLDRYADAIDEARETVRHDSQATGYRFNLSRLFLSTLA